MVENMVFNNATPASVRIRELDNQCVLGVLRTGGAKCTLVGERQAGGRSIPSLPTYPLTSGASWPRRAHSLNVCTNSCGFPQLTEFLAGRLPPPGWSAARAPTPRRRRRSPRPHWARCPAPAACLEPAPVQRLHRHSTPHSRHCRRGHSRCRSCSRLRSRRSRR